MSLPPNLLRLWTARLASKLAIYSAVTYDLYQLSKVRGKDGALKTGVGDGSKRRGSIGSGAQTRKATDETVESCTAAGPGQHVGSRQSRKRLPAWASRPAAPRSMRALERQQIHRRDFSSMRRANQHSAVAVQPEPMFSKDEYNSLVNTYSSPSDLWEQPPATLRHVPLAPRLVITPEQEALPPYTEREVLPPEDTEHKIQITRFAGLLHYEFGHVSLDRLWDAFTDLRAPRLRYIRDRHIHKLFAHLNTVQSKSQAHIASHYFALLEECIGEQIEITTPEWNNAVAFAGRWVKETTATEVKAAVETWMRMEKAGLQATHITFNILFDIAVKAGRYALADTIYNELKMREMPLDRYFYCSLIYYAGLRGDGEAVRQAFRDLVNAGEIVSTSVMNCVILSLIRAGEAGAAENVFAKMKRLYEQKLGTADPEGWRAQRKLHVKLGKSARRLRKERDQHEASFFGGQYSTAEKKEQLQNKSPIAPGSQTYAILIKYHCYTTGDLKRIQELLAELKDTGLRVDGTIYVAMFRGFAQHGGKTQGAWTRALLENHWKEFLAASEAPATSRGLSPDSGEVADRWDSELAPDISEDERSPYYTGALAMAAVRAFYRCAGKIRMLEVWQEVQDGWDNVGELSADERLDLQRQVEGLVRVDGVYR